MKLVSFGPYECPTGDSSGDSDNPTPAPTPEPDDNGYYDELMRLKEECAALRNALAEITVRCKENNNAYMAFHGSLFQETVHIFYANKPA